jgi:ATP-dependent helicase/nuclease subunit A
VTDVTNRKEPKDQAARDKIIHKLETTFLVEAGAGSGKTTSLVDRMVALIQTGTATIDQIASITFTNKAADELRARFRTGLEEARSRANGQMEISRLTDAVRHFDQAFIGTIHSFCGQLLRERPIEARVDPGFTEMDENQCKEFRNRCWDDYLVRVRQDGSDRSINELAAISVDVKDLRDVYHRVSQYTDVEVVTQATDRPDFERIRVTLLPLLVEATMYIPTSPPEKGWDDLQSAVHQANHMIKVFNVTDELKVLQLAKRFDRKLNVTLNRWLDKDMAREIRDQFHDWQINVLYPTLQLWKEYLHSRVIEFVLPAVGYCQQRRMEAGLLDFQDLLMKAAELLREHPSVRNYFHRRYTRLMVDEFQDTDPIQAEMMFLLTGDNPDESNWRKQTPAPGSLFVVGDPKQSIYRFRRADITTYNFVRDRIQQCGEVLELFTNFRSVKSIGEYVNNEFKSRFIDTNEKSDQQARYVNMETEILNPESSEALSGVFTITLPLIGNKAQIADVDSERIAKFIAWACAGNLKIQEKQVDSGQYILRDAKPSDFMILLKRKEFIHLYAQKLEKYGVASDTAGSRARFEEIQALSQLATCLSDLSDRIPLLAVLRGMLFGCCDDALYHFKNEAGHISLSALPKREELSDRSLPVYEALKKLQIYSEWVKQLPALSAFYQMITDLGLIPYATSKETGAIRAGTLIKIMQWVQNDPRMSADWSKLAEGLVSLLDSEEMEGTSLFAGWGDAVRIMNLHKAKGLEAPVVFLACPCGHSDHDAEEHVDRNSEPPKGYFTISGEKDAYNKEIIAQPVGWPLWAELEKGYMNAEEDRLLYVATTRAKQLLIVSQYPNRPAIDPWSALRNTLKDERELDEVDFEPVKKEALMEAPDIEWARKALQEWHQKAIKPTYLVTSVTEQAKKGDRVLVPWESEPTEGEAGIQADGTERKGMAYGSVVHRAIEAVGEGLPDDQLEIFVSMAAEEEGLDEQWIKEAVNTIRTFTKSDIWQRSLQAKQKHHEFSFMTSKEGLILKGVIDLLFEEEDGWVIVDFKTDTFDNEKEGDFIRFYKPQVMAYVDEFERMFGYKVKEAGLYFTNVERYVRVY